MRNSFDRIELFFFFFSTDAFHDIGNLRECSLLCHMLLHSNKGRFVYLRLLNMHYPTKSFFKFSRGKDSGAHRHHKRSVHNCRWLLKDQQPLQDLLPHSRAQDVVLTFF